MRERTVRMSVTSRSPTKMAKPKIAHTMSYDSSGILVIRCQKFGEIRTGSPPIGRQIEQGRLQAAIFDQSLCNSATVQDRDI